MAKFWIILGNYEPLFNTLEKMRPVRLNIPIYGSTPWDPRNIKVNVAIVIARTVQGTNRVLKK